MLPPILPGRPPIAVLLLAAALPCGPVAASARADEPELVPWFPGTAHGQSFSEGAVTALAEELASKPFVPDPPVPQELIDLDYDAYRKIAWKPEMSLWRYLDAPIQAELMHRGDILRNKVRINTVQDGKVVTMAFDRNLFEYRGDVVGLPVDAGVDYAGMKLIGPLPGSEYLQEFFAFAGASYFRGVGAGQVYGASARALAIDIGTPRVEEFPIVRGLWLQRPEVGAQAARVWAILDSHAVAGAYRFDVTPGDPTRAEVRATLFFRHVPTKVALAPASSMFLWGDGFANLQKDPRPEVHDSDGLLIHAGEEGEEENASEWTFRALGQQSYPSVSRFERGAIRGFGLLQRDRDPARYADPETRYEDRPSLWVTPLPLDPHGSAPGAADGADPATVPDVWAGGAVELLEYPTDFEGFDNVAAWWVPEARPTAGEPYPLAYTLTFLSGDPPEHGLARAASWTRKPAAVKGGERPGTRLRIDFVGVPRGVPAAARVTTGGGTDGDIATTPMSDGTVRVMLTVKHDGDAPVTAEVTLFPKSSENVGDLSTAGDDSDDVESAPPGELSPGPLSETWRFLCPPRP